MILALHGSENLFMLQPIGMAVLAAALTYVGVVLVRHWALRGNIIDIPNQRSSHTQPTPRGGGLAIDVIVILFWIGYTLLRLPSSDWPPRMIFAGGAIVIAAISWLDDLYTLSNLIRFVTHFVVAVTIMFFMRSWKDLELPVVGSLSLNGWPVFPFTILWIVGLTSAYNFMDGIDGIAGLQAVAAGLFWAAIAWQSGRADIIVLSLLIVGASLGFLGHNWPPARIFMGDVGSTVLGFMFAVIPLLYNLGPTRVDPLVAILPMWPFVFDTTFTFFRRLRRGENVFVSHRSHLYQRLTISGWSHRMVSLLYFELAIIGAVLAWLWNNGLSIALVVLPVLCIALWIFVNCREKKVSTADLDRSI